MLAKLSRKNQLTLPKQVVDRLEFTEGEERYVKVEVEGNTVVMKPVTVEEKIGDEQWEHFRRWALRSDKEDRSFDSPEKASVFLKRRMKR